MKKLGETESLRSLLNSKHQLFLEVLFLAILRQVQLVEASMRRRKLIRVTISLMNREALRSSHALKIREATQWNLAKQMWMLDI